MFLGGAKFSNKTNFTPLPLPLQILVLCFGLYKSRDTSVHSTAGVAIRQIVVALFDKLSKQLGAERSRQDKKKEGEEEEQELPAGVTDAYLLFQVWVGVCICVQV